MLGERRTDAFFVAGGGLLSRRRMLGGSLAAGAVAVVGSLGMSEAVRAAPAGPDGLKNAESDWLKKAGLEVRSYGLPHDNEAEVKRAIMQFYKELAPAYSFSGTPLQRLRGTLTPNGLHFEVHHGGRPEIDPARHRLMVHGLVEKPLQFDLAALERYPMVSRTHFIECSGNSFFNALFDEPRQLGCDMLHGLVSNSEWTGIPLRFLLEEAALKPQGKWLIAIGNDAPNLARSIPLEKAIEDGMLALYQNGERVRPEQGYPMRLLLPGFEGNMNIKWLTSLQVVDRPAHTKDESGEYTDLLPDGKVLQFSFAMGVKSVITHPSGSMSMSGPGFYEVSGLAWSGSGPVSKVEVSADGGTSWTEADLHPPVLSKAMTRFSIPWQWSGAPAVLMSRAHDAAGNVQPTRTAWKQRYAPQNGNHNNAIQAWRITETGTVENVHS